MAKIDLMITYPFIFLILMIFVFMYQIFNTKNIEDSKKYGKINNYIFLTVIVVYTIIALI